MEFKILNTLWTKQVKKYPKLDKAFGFMVSDKIQDYLKFREAGAKLIGEGLIRETEDGAYYLTNKGRKEEIWTTTFQ